jgi:taurine dioxygenase
MITVKKLTPHFGAEISGVDITKSLDDETFAAVSKAFFENQVVVFRNQALTPEQQIAFTARFGELEQHVRKESRLEGQPQIFIVSNVLDRNGVPIGGQDVGRFWHSDLSYKDKPSMLSALHAIEVPVKDGATLGDTRYASAAAAYDALPDAMKRKLDGLMAVHSYLYYRTKNRQAQKRDAENGGRVVYEPEISDAQLKSVPDMAIPVVRIHPVTGRKCLFVNEGHTSHILGLPGQEADSLLKSLCEHIVKPKFTYCHNWRVGDLLMWDNCSTQHKATFDYDLPLRRLMYRTTVRGFDSIGVPA